MVVSLTRALENHPIPTLHPLSGIVPLCLQNAVGVSPALRIYHPIPTFVPLSGIVPLCLQNAVGVSPALRIYHPIPTFVPLSGIVPNKQKEQV